MKIFQNSRRGTAAVEFALAFPVLMMSVGAAVDFGMLNYYQSALTTAVAAGSEYALLTGNTVTGANVRSVVQQTVVLPTSITATITAPGNSTSPAAPACACITGTSGSYALTAATCGTTCTLEGSPAKYYLYISGSASYSPMVLNAGSILGATKTLTRTARVLVQ